MAPFPARLVVQRKPSEGEAVARLGDLDGTIESLAMCGRELRVDPVPGRSRAPSTHLRLDHSEAPPGLRMMSDDHRTANRGEMTCRKILRRGRREPMPQHIGKTGAHFEIVAL